MPILSGKNERAPSFRHGITYVILSSILNARKTGAIFYFF